MTPRQFLKDGDVVRIEIEKLGVIEAGLIGGMVAAVGLEPTTTRL